MLLALKGACRVASQRRGIAAACLLACLVAAWAGPRTAAAQDRPLGPGEIQQAITRARDFLIRQQKPDGCWEALHSADKRVGATGLVLLALANAGLEAELDGARRPTRGDDLGVASIGDLPTEDLSRPPSGLFGVVGQHHTDR